MLNRRNYVNICILTLMLATLAYWCVYLLDLGVAANTIARIETGNRGISIDLAIELVVRFDTTLDYIFLGRE